MKVDLTNDVFRDEELLVYPITIERLKSISGDDHLSKCVSHVKDLGDFKAKREESHIVTLHKNQKIKRVLLIGLGDKKTADEEVLRRSYSIAIKKVHSLKLNKISSIVPDVTVSEQKLIKAIVEGVGLSNYQFQKYINDKERKVNPITDLTIYHDKTKKPEKFTKTINEACTLCKYTNIARDLVNENSNRKFSLEFSKIIKSVSEENNLEIIELEEEKLKELNMNLILAVNSGSNHPPRLLEINYEGAPNSSKRVALVGKGVTFDTGGLNLKPTKSIEDMKLDMAGAATVVSIINCAAELKLKLNITAVVPLVENMIGPSAYKPGDIFDSYAKKSVEIRNTDAEGRLILADALAYTIDKYKPDLVVDIATLTGACLVALGEFYAGVMANDQKMMDQLLKSSVDTSECVWQLPLYDDLAKSLKSDIADLTNSSSKRFGGTIFGGLFLKEFVGKTPWIHIDFAGPAFFESNHYYMKKGGTGFGVRLMIDFLKNVKI